VGFTVIVKYFEAPVSVPCDGVTVSVAVIAAVVLLMAVKDDIFPEPEAASPMPGLVLVQVKVVPADEPEKVTVEVAVLLHTTWFAGWFTSGCAKAACVHFKIAIKNKHTRFFIQLIFLTSSDLYMKKICRR
jgi:hypothetical protein